MDSSSTDSIHGTLHSTTKSRSTPPYPKHRTTLCQPDQNELAHTHATHRHTSLKSGEEKGGGVDIDMTTTLLQTIVMLRARISFAEYIINERKTKIPHHMIRRPDTPELRPKPMMFFFLAKLRSKETAPAATLDLVPQTNDACALTSLFDTRYSPPDPVSYTHLTLPTKA